MFYILQYNSLELRVDAWKLCQQSRRPEPRSAEDIGTWFLNEFLIVICLGTQLWKPFLYLLFSLTLRL